MHFNMTKPCNNCPFRKDGFIPLHPGRAEDIANVMLHEGGTFTCHKTARSLNARRAGVQETHCAGALLFVEKNGGGPEQNNMLRIAYRLGLYNPDDFTNKKAQQLVFDTKEEMVDAHTAWRPVRREGNSRVAGEPG